MSTTTHVQVTCPACSKVLRVRREYLGRRAQCKHCEATLTISEGAPTTSAGAMAAAKPVDEVLGADEATRDGPPAPAGSAAPAGELEALRARLEAAEADRTRERDDLARAHERALADLRAEAEADRARLAEEREAARSEADRDRSRLADENDALRAEFDRERDRLAAETDRERDRFKAELEAFRAGADRERAELAAKLDALRVEADWERAELVAKLDATTADADRERAEFTSQLESSRLEIEAASRARDEAREEAEALKARVEHLEDYAGDLERNRADAEAHHRVELDRLGADLEEALRRGEAESRRVGELSEQLRRLREDLDALSGELSTAREALDRTALEAEAAAASHQEAIARAAGELEAELGRSESLRGELLEVAAARDALRGDFAAAQARIDALNRRVEQAQQAGDQIRGLLRRVGLPL